MKCVKGDVSRDMSIHGPELDDAVAADLAAFPPPATTLGGALKLFSGPYVILRLPLRICNHNVVMID